MRKIKFDHIKIIVQFLILALLIVNVIVSFQNKNQIKSLSGSGNGSGSSDSTLLNSLSARLGQVQADLYQIKAKVLTP